MGTTYKAVTVVGCKIPKSRLFEIKVIRGCEHQIPESLKIDAQFCPQCGKKLWIETTCVDPQYDEAQGTLCGFRVFSNHWDDFVIVAGRGAYVEADLHSGPNVLNVYTPNVSKDMERRMSEYGFWCDEMFGIWSLLLAY